MPELPEVQTVIDDLKQAGIVGREIKKVHVNWERTVSTPNVASFKQLLEGKKILGLERRGKFLIFRLSQNYDLFIHLRMTGRLHLVSDATYHSPYIRLWLELDQQQLHYHDTRKFGRWYLIPHSQDFLNKMGPEPLDEAFSAEQFFHRLHKHKRALKPLLLDQSFLAGLGNIYVDEALWEAELHPLQSANSLNKQEATALHQAIQKVLQRGIDSQGTTLGAGRTNFYRLSGHQGSHQTLLQVFRRTGLPCPRCHSTIERLRVAQRSTHICPICQKLKNKAL